MPRSFELDENFVKRLSAVVPYVERLIRNTPNFTPGKKDTLPVPIKRFELTEALVPGGNADAVFVEWAASDSDYAVSTDTLVVYDAIGMRRGRAAIGSENGFRGYARKFYGAGRWEIIDMQWQARFIEFSLDSELLATEGSEDATVTDFWDGLDPDPTSAGITVWNKSASSDYVFSGASGNKGIARYDIFADRYRITQMECP